MEINETLFSLIAFTIFLSAAYLIWRWVTKVPGLPRYPFWSRSKVVACAIYVAVYVPFAVVVPGEELDQWGHSIASYGGWSLLLILFPEINRWFVSRMTLDNMMTVNVTRGLGWALLILWSLVTVPIVVGFLI